MSAVARIGHHDAASVRVGPTASAGVALGDLVFSPDGAESLAARLLLAAAEARRAARLRDGFVRVRVLRRDGTEVGDGLCARVTARNNTLLCALVDGSPQWFDLRTGSQADNADGRRHRRALDPGDRDALFPQDP